jgi:hypothetical protein
VAWTTLYIYIFNESEPFRYVNDNQLKQSRDPDHYEEKLELDYVLPHDLIISWRIPDGMMVVLDTKASVSIF